MGGPGVGCVCERTHSWGGALTFPRGDSCPFVCFSLATGSPVLSGYYGVRRSLLSDSDFHPVQLASDASAPGGAKPFPCEPSVGQSHAALLDSYFPEPYGDPRPPALAPSTGSLLSASPLPPLLPPPFASDPTHLVLVSMRPPSVGEPGCAPQELPSVLPATHCSDRSRPG